MASLTPYQLDILVKTVLGEARGEGETGMAAVAHNILNRANSGRYPEDPAEVALQPSQYSTWNSGEGGNNPQQFKPGTKAYQRAAQVVQAVASGQIPDMTGGALQYHASNITPYWADEANTNGALRVGNHTFYPTRPVPAGEIPSVASLLDTRRAPTPATPSANVNAYRSSGVPQNLIAQSLAGIQRANPRVTGLGESLAMNPVTGGRQPIPAMDASYDQAAGAMRLTGAPVTTQSSYMNAPVPAQQSPMLAATRSTSPALQSALARLAATRANTPDPLTPSQGQVVASIPTTRPRTLLPELPPSTLGQPPSTRAVQSVPVTPQQTQAQRLAALYAGGGPTRPPQAAPRIDPVGAMPSVASMNTFANGQRLMPGQSAMQFVPTAQQGAVQSGGYSRDAVQRQLAANTARMAAPVLAAQPVQPIRRAPVPASMSLNMAMRRTPLTIPQGMTVTSSMLPGMHAAQVSQRTVANSLANGPLRITVDGANPIAQALMKPTAVAQLQSQGMSPSQAYAQANANASANAIANAAPQYQNASATWRREW